jgi:hypothetical protein
LQLLFSRLWFNGNQPLQEAAAELVKMHISSPSESSRVVCLSLMSSLVRGIETPLAAFANTGQVLSTTDIVYLDDSKRVSAVHSMLWAVAESTMDSLLSGTTNSDDSGFLTLFSNAVEETISRLNAAFASIPALSNVISTYEAQLLAKSCLCQSFYSSVLEQGSSIAAICKKLDPHLSRSGLINSLRLGLDAMQLDIRHNLASRCVFTYLMKLAATPAPVLMKIAVPPAAPDKPPIAKRSEGSEGSLSTGDRVRRGPDWKWGSQDGDGRGVGTVQEGLDSDGWIAVKWDHGGRNKYSIFCCFETTQDVACARTTIELIIIPQVPLFQKSWRI